MRLSFILLLMLNVSLVACSNADYGDEVTPEKDVIEDGAEHLSAGNNDAPEAETLELPDDSLQKAFDSFKAQGVPSVPLSQALEFYRNNRASVGGLEDASCLIKPMSESGEIAANSNRYDPTTLKLLKQGIRNERYIMIVDFTQTNTNKRGYLLDMQPDAAGKFKVEKMTIAHGYGSQAVNGVPQAFTNVSGKGTTVSGFFVSAMVTYKYYGTASGSSYSSTGLRLYGLESTNNTAEKTSKVSHGAPYVTDSRAGTSAGCPAMTQSNAGKILPKLTGGILWYHYTKINSNISYKAPTCVKNLAQK